MRLCLISDRFACPKGQLLRRLALAARAGVDFIQIRDKDLPDAERFELLKKTIARCRPYGAKILINGRPDMALAAGADGVHLGKKTIPVAEARKLLGKKKLIGYSAHSLAEIKKAARDGADFCTYSPVFKKKGKQKGPPKGMAVLKRIVEASPIPVFALGGVNLKTAHKLKNTGVTGAAFISVVLSAKSPSGVVEYLKRLPS